jgi:hypothetical protein
MPDCPICCESYNKSIRDQISCPGSNCDFTACKSCIRTYLLGTTSDPHCMNCKTAWPQDFMIFKLNRSYYTNNYQKHRRGLLLEREISKLPDTMEAAGREEKAISKSKEQEVIEIEKRKLKQQYTLLEHQSSRLSNEVWKLRRGIDPTKQKKQFIMPCPSNDCRGYLSTHYKCELCKLHTCSKCHEIIGDRKDDPHECDENSVKSAEMIKKDTKPCPSCGTRIMKMVGCNQMWCTSCNSAFDWRTGQIDHGTVHNPHYYEFLRQQDAEGGGGGYVPRNPQDVVCGGLVGYYQVRNKVMRHMSRNWLVSSEDENQYRDFRNLIWKWHRLVNHITNDSVVNMREKVRDFGNFEEYRVDYILKKITKDDLGKIVYRKDNLRRKYAEMLHIYELLSVVGIESFTGLANHLYVKIIERIVDKLYIAEDLSLSLEEYTIKSKEYLVEFSEKYNQEIQKGLDEYIQLCNYCNKELEKISVTYNQSVPQINIAKLEWSIGCKFSLTQHKKNILKEENVKVGENKFTAQS